MCTYQTQQIDVRGSGKGPDGWFPLTDATVYLDHPVHAPAEHTVNVDFLNPTRGPSARVAVELDPTAAEALARAILVALATAPEGVLGSQRPSVAAYPLARAGGDG